jgi:type II secretory pathway component PulM
MTIDDVPAPILAGIIVALTAVVTWAIRTVREADRVTTSAKRSMETVRAQSDCIAALEAKVKVLTDALATATSRITTLEDVIRNWSTIRDIQTEPRAVRHEAREIRAEARQVAAEARATTEAT